MVPRAVCGMAHGVTALMSELFFSSSRLGIIDSFVHAQGAEMFWTRESLSDLFYYSLAGIILLGWWIVPSVSSSESTLVQKLSQWPEKQP